MKPLLERARRGGAKRLAVPATAVVLGAFLSGCTTFYQPAPRTTLVPVRLLDPGTPSICIDGQHMGLSETTNGTVRRVLVPAGKRITLHSGVYKNNGVVSAGCSVGVSLIPEAGTRLVLQTNLAGQRCFVNIVREDATTATGVAPEPTLARPQC